MHTLLPYFCYGCVKQVHVSYQMACVECGRVCVEIYDPLKHISFNDSIEAIRVILDELRNLDLHVRSNSAPSRNRPLRRTTIAQDIRNYVPDYAIDEVVLGLMESDENKRRRPFSDIRKLRVVPSYTDGECSICLSQYAKGERGYEFRCKHFFHRKCARRWLTLQNTCPNCRLELE